MYRLPRQRRAAHSKIKCICNFATTKASQAKGTNEARRGKHKDLTSSNCTINFDDVSGFVAHSLSSLHKAIPWSLDIEIHFKSQLIFTYQYLQVFEHFYQCLTYLQYLSTHNQIELMWVNLSNCTFISNHNFTKLIICKFSSIFINISSISQVITKMSWLFINKDWISKGSSNSIARLLNVWFLRIFLLSFTTPVKPLRSNYVP